ncbi:NDP-hexose 2,3-dehydratase family protein [Streptomyces sp. NPDC051658]|uniref:NDP-hexose 2,3-dehydratase family protein n=1 Tax=unclassified Streptomyces TaxID=2593676 RepID=UPI002250219C|nr:NDP-hexose 2,3-dehydratase family protein [Streptomyces sp. NBC_00893]MCX4851945.1 NDP-hexose 2,3-dehydratase family protein [Streptomyces sp. NBC_00893]
MSPMLAVPTALRPRYDAVPAARIARSAAIAQGAHLDLGQFHRWFAWRRAAHPFRVGTIPFAELEGWYIEEGTGNIRHHSGRFFSVEGLRVTVDSGPGGWHQPIIRQPEIGILGILVKEFDGVLHCLMQAKMEPGNPNLLQLSPTVQATRSNYTKVHGGADVKYLEYFTRPGRATVLADVLQSEHGSWFHGKHNRNMIVETTDDVPLYDDFCWLTFGQIAQLLRLDNLVNMDARTVLSCAPMTDAEAGTSALHSDAELAFWLTESRSRHDVRTDRVPLAGLPGWERDARTIHQVHGRYFDVVAASVEAGSREVAHWTQPLFRPRGEGIAAMLTRRIDGVPHLLAHARREGGLRETVELSPTVMCTPDNYAGLAAHDRPPFLDLALRADPSRIRYEALHSEEGGRFLDAVSRYLLIDADERQAPLEEPTGYRWVTPGQLSRFIQHGHCVNVQARTLAACLAAAELGDHG